MNLFDEVIINVEEFEDKEMRRFLIENEFLVSKQTIGDSDFYCVKDYRSILATGDTKEEAVKKAMENIEQIKKDKQAIFIENIQKGNPVRRTDFAEYLNSMFGLEADKLDKLVDFMAKMNNIKFSKAEQNQNITEAYLKMMETYKPEPFVNLDRKFYLLENKLSKEEIEERLDVMEKVPYWKMIKEIQHYKDIYDRENIDIIVNGIKQRLLNRGKSISKTTIKRFIKRFGSSDFEYMSIKNDKQYKSKKIYISNEVKIQDDFKGQIYTNNSYLSSNKLEYNRIFSLEEAIIVMRTECQLDKVKVCDISSMYFVTTEEETLKDFKIVQEGKVYCVEYYTEEIVKEEPKKSKIDEMNEYWQEFLEWKTNKDI